MSESNKNIKNSANIAWQKLANQYLCLRPNVSVHEEMFDGQLWLVLSDPFTNQYFRLSFVAYEFIRSLDIDKTLDEVWQTFQSEKADEMPTQDEIVHLLIQLQNSGLLRYKGEGNPDLQYRLRHKKEQKARYTKLLSLIAIRFTLFNPNSLLNILKPIGRLMMSKSGFLLWLVVVFLGAKVMIENFDAFYASTQGVLAPDNLLWLYTGYFFVKCFHEMAHGIVAKHYGCEVHKIGLILIALVPMPFVDATSGWSLGNRYQRLWISLAGVATELFVASISAYVWVNTGQGTLVHALAYNVMFTASVSAIIFNGNPLLKFDGYYAFSDFIAVPNLASRSMKQLGYWAKRLFLRLNVPPPETKGSIIFLLTFYGIASFIYRIGLSLQLFFMVVGQYLILGIIMAASAFVGFFILPVIKLLYFLFFNPQVHKEFARAYTTLAMWLLLVVIGLGLIPMREFRFISGVMESAGYTELYSGVPGYVSAVHVKSGDVVKEGQIIVEMRNEELARQIEIDTEEVRRLRLLEAQAEVEVIADIKPIQRQIEVSVQRIADLKRRMESLKLRAPHDGIWSNEESGLVLGQWVSMGQSIGVIIAQNPWMFVAVIPQSEAGSLLRHLPKTAEVKISGQAELVSSVTDLKLIPHDQWILPSQSLSWVSGGDIEIVTVNEKGAIAAEPFFLIQGKFHPVGDIVLMHGRDGMMRIEGPQRPLAMQWFDRLTQYLQKRYRAQ